MEGIFFYNFTTPEFNVNVCQLPFWALTVYYSFKSINYSKLSDLILLGIFMSLGFLTKYFLYFNFINQNFFILETFKEKNFQFKIVNTWNNFY